MSTPWQQMSDSLPVSSLTCPSPRLSPDTKSSLLPAQLHVDGNETVPIIAKNSTHHCSSKKYAVFRRASITLWVSDRASRTCTCIRLQWLSTLYRTRLWKTKLSVNPGHRRHFAPIGMPPGQRPNILVNLLKEHISWYVLLVSFTIINIQLHKRVALTLSWACVSHKFPASCGWRTLQSFHKRQRLFNIIWFCLGHDIVANRSGIAKTIPECWAFVHVASQLGQNAYDVPDLHLAWSSTASFCIA